MKAILAILITIVTFNVAHAQQNMPPHVAEAHQAYLAGDGDRMLEEMHQALLSSQNDPVIVKNLTDLLDKYVVENKRYPTPNYKTNPGTGFLFMSSHLLKRYDDQQVRYYFAVGANLTEAGAVQSIQFVRYPNEVMIDTQAGVGKFEGADGVDPYAWGDQKTTEPKLGLYNIVLKYKNQPPLNAWVILTHRNQANDTPQINTPSLKQVYNVANPSFAWQPFRSSNSLVTDKNKLRFAVRSIQQTDTSTTETDAVSGEILNDATKMTVGDHSNMVTYTGVDSLSRGTYAFRLDERERMKFGALNMIRSAISKVKFEVK